MRKFDVFFVVIMNSLVIREHVVKTETSKNATFCYKTTVPIWNITVTSQWAR